VKTFTARELVLPSRILGAAWRPQHEQILAGIFQSLFLVAFSKQGKLLYIDYVPAHILQATPAVFEPRAKLSASAKRAGWQGFTYNMTRLPQIGIVRLFPPGGSADPDISAEDTAAASA
jgi:type II restriction enzyme